MDILGISWYSRNEGRRRGWNWRFVFSFPFFSFLVVAEDEGKCCQHTVKTSTSNVCLLLHDDIVYDRFLCACMCFLYFIYK